jgi:Dolichyl-phosphate-mannose-protein mannosyltransferase
MPLLLLLAISVLARIPALINARGVNSDAAVVGLQAIHVLHGEWSPFLWGAGYQASFDALLIAAGFAVTGPSALTLMVVPLVGYLVLIGLTYDVLRRAVGVGAAVGACLPLVFAPQSINGVALYAPRQWSITAAILAVWLASRATGRRAPWWLAGSGLVAGLAVYLDLFTLQMMPAVGVFAL